MPDIRTLIVDDEVHARLRVGEMLASSPDIEVVGEARNGDEAVRLITSLRPDLVFLDIQMPERDGFAVLAALDQPPPAVIFTTAHDTYALRAFEVHALDYLLKPYDRARFQQALDRARAAVARRDSSPDARLDALVRELRAGSPWLTRIAVKSGGRVRVLPVGDIDVIEASGNYLRLFTKGTSHLLRETMQNIEGRLDPRQFLRIHRSSIVNLDRIVELEPDYHGDYVVKLADGRRLPLSRSYRDRLKGRLGPEF